MITTINPQQAQEQRIVETKAMKLLQIYVLFIFISTTTAAAELVPRYAKQGCIDKCGNLLIPYPFGMGQNCFLNRWFAVKCIASKPYLPALKHLPLLGVDLNDQMVLVNVSMTTDCQAPVWNSSQILDLVHSPFLFSKMHNTFTVEGCGAASISSHGNVLTGCSTMCFQRMVKLDNCYGVNCCRAKVPYYLDTFSVNVSNNKSCLSAFLVAANSYVHNLISGQSFDGKVSSIPTVLRWRLPDDDSTQAICKYNFSRHELHMGKNTSVHSGMCRCMSEFEHGNPYLSDGCKLTEECTKCMESWGSCVYKESYAGERNFVCEHDQFYHRLTKSSSSRAIFLGVSMSILVLILTALGFALYKIIQKAKDKRRKKRLFERNGGLILKQQEASNEGLVDKTKLFTSNELEKARDFFNENRIIGRGGQGTVYKGMLTDGRIVAVKKSKVVDQSQLEQFINEMVILSQVNHRNVVKLLGCCLETDVPILVSEFIPNGTLYEHIHHENPDVFISLNMRLQIAAEVAGALSYLHSATSIPIYHRDIKSTNILLDEKYRPKISDFGTSRLVSIGQTHLTTLVNGTLGYLDPEYFQSSQFTEKSDVYSFGVVLVELLTGEKPICLRRFGGNISLVTHFKLSIEEDRVMSALDAKMVKEGGRDVLMEVANLAMRCLNSCGKNRPTMKEVSLELETIRISQGLPMV